MAYPPLRPSRPFGLPNTPFNPMTGKFFGFRNDEEGGSFTYEGPFKVVDESYKDDAGKNHMRIRVEQGVIMRRTFNYVNTSSIFFEDFANVDVSPDDTDIWDNKKIPGRVYGVFLDSYPIDQTSGWETGVFVARGSPHTESGQGFFYGTNLLTRITLLASLVIEANGEGEYKITKLVQQQFGNISFPGGGNMMGVVVENSHPFAGLIKVKLYPDGMGDNLYSYSYDDVWVQVPNTRYVESLEPGTILLVSESMISIQGVSENVD